MLEPMDRQTIADIGTAFAALLDERRFDEVAALFSEDGVLSRADGSRIVGRVNIQAAQSARHADVRTVHHVSAPFLETGGKEDEVRGRSTFVAVTVDARDGSTQGWVIGYFADRYVRRAGAWSIAERSIHLTHRQ